MHSLPCASGGEDGVCLALTQLSKGLMEDNTGSLQAGGCDSSDCLFCQYRSNSPFHLNAYAGKLTSLLKKRSHNGMTRTSLSSFVDTTTEQGAALMTATAAAMCNGGKRHKITSSSGIVASSMASSMLYLASSSAPSGAGPRHAAAATAASSHAGRNHPHELSDAPHNCGTMCSGRLCSEHAFLRPAANTAIPTAEASAAAASAMAAGAVAVDAIPPSQHSPSKTQFVEVPGGSSSFGRSTEAVHVVAPAAGGGDVAGVGSESARGGTSRATRSPPKVPDAEAAGPGPSSLQLSKLFQSSHYQQDILQLYRHRFHRSPSSHGSHMQVGQLLAAEPQPDARQQQQARFVGGRALPLGWTFRSEWQHQSDPAPAALQEVLQLPGAASFWRLHRHGGKRSCQVAMHRGPHAAGSVCVGSAGIVCALEFSPDGRLLAAGGVDKQIRLYNLGNAFEDGWVDGDDFADGSADDDEDLDVMGLVALPRTGEGDRWAGGAGRVRRGRCCDGSGSEDEDCSDDERDASLLAAVQRMPSKISSMAWSPFLDGVLTVGDYDGVLLQLHIASGHQLADVEAHGGRKIWSVAHSALTPHLVASAADDRCARLWAGRGLAQCIASVQPNPRAAVCSVDFSPTCEHLMAAACSDRTAYLYDMRSLGRGPLAALRHHSRPASYCRFLGGDRLVTAATDASLALWDITKAVPTLTGMILSPRGSGGPSPPSTMQKHGVGSAAAAAAASSSRSTVATSDVAAAAAAAPCSGGGGLEHPWRVFRGHRNEKNFVGLSVRAADGLLACGSECSRAFAYHTSWSDPLATLELPWCANTASAATVAASDVMCGGVAGASGRTGPCHGGDAGSSGGGGRFVSAVCWQPAEAAAVLGLPPLLASATSLGVVNISVLAARH